MPLLNQSLALVSHDYLPQVNPVAVEQAMMIGDLSQMTPEVRVAYYIATCKSLGLNPLTKPFQALKTESGEIHLYPDKGCAEQLRKRDGISLRILSREYIEDLYIVTVEATTPDGRTEQSEGVVSMVETLSEWKEGTRRNGGTYRYKQDILGPDGEPIIKRLTGDASGRARMRAETKAKRRVTLAICGLGMPDVDAGRPVQFNPQQGTLQEMDGIVDIETGEVHPAPRMLNTPAEQAKGLDGHIADLYGEPPPVVAPPHAIWATIEGWYADAGQPEKYAEFEVWVCQHYRVDRLSQLGDKALEELGRKMYARLEPLIVARQAAQEATQAQRELAAKGQEEAREYASTTLHGELIVEDASSLKNDIGENAGAAGASWGPDSPNLFEAEEREAGEEG